MPRTLKQGILGASTTILSKDIDKYAFMCGSKFYETDVRCQTVINIQDLSIIAQPMGLKDFSVLFTKPIV